MREPPELLLLFIVQKICQAKYFSEGDGGNLWLDASSGGQLEIISSISTLVQLTMFDAKDDSLR